MFCPFGHNGSLKAQHKCDSVATIFDAFAVIEDNEFDSADCFLRFEKI